MKIFTYILALYFVVLPSLQCYDYYYPFSGINHIEYKDYCNSDNSEEQDCSEDCECSCLCYFCGNYIFLHSPYFIPENPGFLAGNFFTRAEFFPGDFSSSFWQPPEIC
ncbi:MAG: hypothetical protein JNJ56_01985 [Ignavibacteria bacterium]|nr:hypothetical protein [Ignavibacteria bacterium]